MSKLLPVSEIYGPVAQGEGLLMGVPTIFVRFGGCDYRCSWCDTLYAVLPTFWKEWTRMTPQEIVDQLTALNTHIKHITLSGGNPAMHDLSEFLDLVRTLGYTTAIETQGTIYQTWMWRVNHVTVSPKPPSSGNVTAPDLSTLKQLVHLVDYKGSPSSLKVVVFDDVDYEYAKMIHREFPSTPLTLQVGTYQNPELDTGLDILDDLKALQAKTLADPLMANVRVLPQLHTLLYGLKRGI